MLLATEHDTHCQKIHLSLTAICGGDFTLVTRLHAWESFDCDLLLNEETNLRQFFIFNKICNFSLK